MGVRRPDLSPTFGRGEVPATAGKIGVLGADAIGKKSSSAGGIDPPSPPAGDTPA